MRETSMDAWRYVTESELLGERQRSVWLWLHTQGPMTASECTKDSGVPGAWKRLSELKSLGLVKELPPRLCRITKRAALVWQAVVAEPRRPAPKIEVAKCPTCLQTIRHQSRTDEK